MGLSQTSPIPRSPDGDDNIHNKITNNFCHRTAEHPLPAYCLQNMVRGKVEVDKLTPPDIPFAGFTTASQNWSYLKFVYLLHKELFSWNRPTPALLSTSLRGLVRARRMSVARMWSVLSCCLCGLWGGEGWRQAGRVQVWTCVHHSKSPDYRCLSHQTLATLLLQTCFYHHFLKVNFRREE